MWSQILIFISCLAGIIFLLNRIPEGYTDIKVASVSALVSVLSVEIISFIPIRYEDLITEGLIFLLFTALLIFLLMITRSVKPDFARYPYPFVYMPVIILVVYPLIVESEALIRLVIMMLQGGAIIVFLLLWAGHTERFKRNWLVAAGAVCLLAAYIIFWFLEDTAGDFYNWSWQFLVALGIVTTTIELPRILKPST